MTFDTLDLSTLPEAQRLAFYGALFAMAAGDGDVDESEDDRIFASLDLHDLSAEARSRVLRLAIQPPPLERGLLAFRDADVELRRALMLSLIDVVLADGLVEPAEHVGLHEARDVLRLDRDDVATLHDLATAAQTAEGVQRPLCPVPLSS
jgi:uncharacterized tellurite resistance protein B-like protein